jgi:DNA-binding Lrp family transcriptional regulator
MIKKKDRLILSHLRDDARRSLTQISRETKIPLTTVFERHSKLEKTHIKSYVTLLDYKKLGYNVRAIIAATCSDWKRPADLLMVHKNVNSVYRMHLPKGIMIDAVFKTMSELEEFLDLLLKLKLKNREVFHVIEPLLEEQFYTTKDFDVVG